uniref:Uncharacterized protein n=1 Tax=Rhizophora mucronata TaxID=61149 RepID=A0A2P2J174_RHIMU
MIVPCNQRELTILTPCSPFFSLVNLPDLNPGSY